MKIRKKYFIKQRLWGLVSIITGVISPRLLEGDLTCALFLVLGGIFLLFTKELLWDDEYRKELKQMGLKTEELT